MKLLIKEINPAITGVEQLVPSTPSISLLSTTGQLCPTALISGYPLPFRLNTVGRFTLDDRYLLT